MQKRPEHNGGDSRDRVSEPRWWNRSHRNVLILHCPSWKISFLSNNWEEVSSPEDRILALSPIEQSRRRGCRFERTSFTSTQASESLAIHHTRVKRIQEANSGVRDDGTYLDFSLFALPTPISRLQIRPKLPSGPGGVRCYDNRCSGYLLMFSLV